MVAFVNKREACWQAQETGREKHILNCIIKLDSYHLIWILIIINSKHASLWWCNNKQPIIKKSKFISICKSFEYVPVVLSCDMTVVPLLYTINTPEFPPREAFYWST